MAASRLASLLTPVRISPLGGRNQNPGRLGQCPATSPYVPLRGRFDLEVADRLCAPLRELRLTRLQPEALHEVERVLQVGEPLGVGVLAVFLFGVDGGSQQLERL